MTDELATPGDEARLLELHRIPCRDGHSHDLWGGPKPPHSLVECNAKPMVERLGEGLPFQPKHDWAALRAELDGDRIKVTCDCGAVFEKTPGISWFCTQCGTVHS